MLVLIIAHGHPDFHPGGGEVFAYGLYRNFRDKQQDVYFLGCIYSVLWPENQPDSLVTDAGDPWVSFLKISKFRPFLNSQPDAIFLAERLAGFLKTLNPDIIHFHHTFLIGVEALHVTRNTLPNSKILLTLHEYWSICHRDGQMVRTNAMRLCQKASPQRCNGCFPNYTPAEFRMREIFIKTHLRLVDRFLCPSRLLLKRYAEWGLPKEKLKYIENGHLLAETENANSGNSGSCGHGRHMLKSDSPVPIVGSVVKNPYQSLSFIRTIYAQYKDFSVRASAQFGLLRNRFAFFGQFTPFKGIDVLLQAVDILAEQEIGFFSVELYGTAALQEESFRGPLMKKLERMSDIVTFHGPYDQKSVVSLMKKVD